MARIVKLDTARYDDWNFSDDHDLSLRGPPPSNWAVVGDDFPDDVAGEAVAGNGNSRAVCNRGLKWPTWEVTETRAEAAQELHEAQAAHWDGQSD